MGKDLKDEELDRLLEEEMMREAEMIEKSLLGDDAGERHMSEEELDKSYERFVKRLKAEGLYQEEDAESQTAEIVRFPGGYKNAMEDASEEMEETSAVNESGENADNGHKISMEEISQIFSSVDLPKKKSWSSMGKAAGFILLCAITIFIAPIIISAIVQTLMFSGQTVMAFALYQVAAMIMQPSFIAMSIIGSFIITFVFTLIATYIYNLLGSKGKGIILDLSKDGDMTSLNSIDPVSLIIVLTVISLIFNIILAIITLISGGNAYQALGNIVGGLINGVIGGGLLAIFYNFLATKLGKLKIELIDN